MTVYRLAIGFLCLVAPSAIANDAIPVLPDHPTAQFSTTLDLTLPQLGLEDFQSQAQVTFSTKTPMVVIDNTTGRRVRLEPVANGTSATPTLAVVLEADSERRHPDLLIDQIPRSGATPLDLETLFEAVEDQAESASPYSPLGASPTFVRKGGSSGGCCVSCGKFTVCGEEVNLSCGSCDSGGIWH